MSTFLVVFGKDLSVMKTLGHGWHLVAHPNGPAIARSEGWTYIGHLARESTDQNDEVPSARIAMLEQIREINPTLANSVERMEARKAGGSQMPVV